MVIGLGLVCLIVALLGRREGLLVLLPAEVQAFLLQKTVFHLLHDDAQLANLSRRWVRMLMICYANSEDEIERLKSELDPVFVHDVFYKTFIEYLPTSVSRVLLPEGHEVQSHTFRCDRRKDPKKQLRRPTQKLQAAVNAVIATSRLQITNGIARHQTKEEKSRAASPANLLRDLRSRKQENNAKIVEAPLAPLFVSQLNPRALVAAMLPSRSIICQAFQVTSALCSAGWLSVSVMLARWPLAQSFLVRSLSRIQNKEALVSRSSQICSLFAALSAGVALAALAYTNRLKRSMARVEDSRNGK